MDFADFPPAAPLHELQLNCGKNSLPVYSLIS